MIQVREYIDDAGRNHFGMWRAKLDPTTRARIDVALDRLERGNTSAMKSVGAGVASPSSRAKPPTSPIPCFRRSTT